MPWLITDITDVSHMTPVSVLSVQSAAVSHSWAQNPMSPCIAVMSENAQTPCAPPELSDPVPAALQAFRLPITQGIEQKLAAAVVPPDAPPTARQKLAQLDAPESGSDTQCVPSGSPVAAVSAHRLSARLHLRPGQSLSCVQSGRQ